MQQLRYMAKGMRTLSTQQQPFGVGKPPSIWPSSWDPFNDPCGESEKFEDFFALSCPPRRTRAKLVPAVKPQTHSNGARDEIDSFMLSSACGKGYVELIAAYGDLLAPRDQPLAQRANKLYLEKLSSK
eukprot:767436-Hanusia_phi.AAC.11